MVATWNDRAAGNWEEVKAAGAVGEMPRYFFPNLPEGRPVEDGRLTDRTIAVGIDTSQKTRELSAVAGSARVRPARSGCPESAS